MALMFYPHPDDTQKGSITERIAVMLDAAERFKAVILETKPVNAAPTNDATAVQQTPATPSKKSKSMGPIDLQHVFNWEEIAILLNEVRSLPEGSEAAKVTKAKYLTQLAEVYEVLRGAKMSKLEAVRMAIVNEAKAISGTGGQA